MRTLDAVVVGSGFGGAVAACRLAEHGRSVLVLERGRRWAREDFPRPGRAGAGWRFGGDRAGLFEVRRFPGMKVIVAAGVGGGSLVYTNVQRVPPAGALQGWPAPLSLDYLQPFYQRIREMLEPTPFPQPLQRIRAFESSHAAAGLGEVERPPLAVLWGSGDEERPNRFGAPQRPCNLCGQCVLGCDRHAKNTLDLNYLRQAETLGAQIWPFCQVTCITPSGSGYEVSFQRRDPELPAGEASSEHVLAGSVYLAAGSLGTTELLLRCRDLHGTLPELGPRLGQGWSANGDFFAGLLGARIPIAPTEGPSVAAAFDAGEREGFYVLEGAIPHALLRRRTSWLRLANAVASLRGLFSRPAALPADLPSRSCGDEEMERLLSRMGVFFLVGRDAGDGRLRLDASGALDLRWNPRESELLLSRMRRYLRELARGYGGWMVVPESWWPVGGMGTVHPLGGCGIGCDPGAGVADPFGRVFGYPNLYVCDGSLFPRALGVPPSMTIAALAEHILERALSE